MTAKDIDFERCHVRMSKRHRLLTHNKAKCDRCAGTGAGAVWAQESLQQMCRVFDMLPKGSAPHLPDGLTSLSEWRTNPHSLWQHVQARRKTLSSLYFKAIKTIFVTLVSTQVGKKIKGDICPYHWHITLIYIKNSVLNLYLSKLFNLL